MHVKGTVLRLFELFGDRLRLVPHFLLRDNRASETRARVKIIAFLAWGDFHARSRFARFTIPEGKRGTTRSIL